MSRNSRQRGIPNMKISRTCFFEKISTIELAIQANLLSNHIHMGGKNTLAATAIAVALTTTSPAFSENSNTTAQQEAITCETKLACQKLTESIQAQIDELDKSDDPDFDKLEALQIQLIAVEKQETKEQEKIIDAKLKAQDAQIAGLRGALLEN